jgi:hypothetical protein
VTLRHKLAVLAAPLILVLGCEDPTPEGETGPVEGQGVETEPWS